MTAINCIHVANDLPYSTNGHIETFKLPLRGVRLLGPCLENTRAVYMNYLSAQSLIRSNTVGACRKVPRPSHDGTGRVGVVLQNAAHVCRGTKWWSLIIN